MWFKKKKEKDAIKETIGELQLKIYEHNVRIRENTTSISILDKLHEIKYLLRDECGMLSGNHPHDFSSWPEELKSQGYSLRGMVRDKELWVKIENNQRHNDTK